MTILENQTKNAVLATMIEMVEKHADKLLKANQKDLDLNAGIDQVLIDRLKIDSAKIDSMMQSLQMVLSKDDPIHHTRYQYTHPNGMKIVNKTFPFGTILIIYESRPDVTVEAAAIAFKSGNKIILKGGKEALNSNLVLVECWHQALKAHQLEKEWIKYLRLSRTETQQFLIEHKSAIDLIVPRGGEGLIRFVKEHAQCPVLVSGRGNNFLYVDKTARLEIATSLISNGKMGKISACNALDKVLIHRDFPEKEKLVSFLTDTLAAEGVALFSSDIIHPAVKPILSDDLWYEEFLDYKLAFKYVPDTANAIDLINTYSGGHSATIVSESEDDTCSFMVEVDAAAVYHNVSTRFTDGGQFGLGAELAISTDKLHHRGPLGLEHLVTNKWYVYGEGQIR